MARNSSSDSTFADHDPVWALLTGCSKDLEPSEIAACILLAGLEHGSELQQ